MVTLTVTLVHGTWAPGAPWTQEGSPLWRELKARFGDSVAVDRFDWSGDNNRIARLEGGISSARHAELS